MASVLRHGAEVKLSKDFTHSGVCVALLSPECPGGDFCWISCSLNEDAQKRLLDFSSWLKNKWDFAPGGDLHGAFQAPGYSLVSGAHPEGRVDGYLPAHSMRGHDSSGAEGVVGEREIMPIRCSARPGCPAAPVPIFRPWSLLGCAPMVWVRPRPSAPRGPR